MYEPVTFASRCLASGLTQEEVDALIGSINERMGLYAQLDDTEPPCKHKWVDTGMPKTWCRICNANGVTRNGVTEESK